METLWTFLSDPDNQQTLAWLGGGLVVAAGGLWAVVKVFLARRTTSAPSPSTTIKADRGGIAAGRDVKITGRTKRPGP